MPYSPPTRGHRTNIDLARSDLAVVLLRAGSNAFEDIAPLMDEAIAALASTAPGTVNLVPEAPR